MARLDTMREQQRNPDNRCTVRVVMMKERQKKIVLLFMVVTMSVLQRKVDNLCTVKGVTIVREQRRRSIRAAKIQVTHLTRRAPNLMIIHAQAQFPAVGLVEREIRISHVHNKLPLDLNMGKMET